MVSFVAYFALFLTMLQLGQGIVWRDCGSKTGKVISFQGHGCHQRHRCDIAPGTNQTIELTFEALENSHTLTVEASSIMAGRVSKFQMPNRDACRHDLACPIEKNGVYTYKTQVYIDPKFPRVAMIIKWQLKDDNNNDVICLMVPAKIL